MTTILTPLGCSRFELNSERKQADTRENPQSCCRRKTEQKRCATPCAAVTEARRGHRPRLLPRQIGRRSRRSSASPRPEFVATAAAIDGPTAPGGLWRSRSSGTDFFSFFSLGLLLLFH